MKQLYYGIVGNGETAALIAPDLAVRWMCLPRFDGTPFFASALDPRRGGGLRLEWDGFDEKEAVREQQYIAETNVLRTAVASGGLRVECVDSMPWGRPVLVRRVTVTRAEGADPKATSWSSTAAAAAGTAPEASIGGSIGGAVGRELVRLRAAATPVASVQWSFDSKAAVVDVDGVPHKVATVVEKDAALVYGWVRGRRDDGASGALEEAFGAIGDGAAGPGARKEGEAAPETGGGAPETVTAEVSVPDAGGEARIVLLLAYGADEGEARHRWLEAASELVRQPAGDPEGLQRDIDFWIDWLRPARRPTGADEDLVEAYVRGLLVMKLLTHEASGAILAAPTASFPAVPGGYDNWDYRYCWIRDGYYTARTYDEVGLHDEARAFYKFVLGLQEPEGHWSQPLYTLDGGGPVELLVDDLQGPGGEKPIRFGNAAYDQLQIDNEPSVLHGLWIHAQRTEDRDFFQRNWDSIKRAAEAMKRLWPEKENGIWEIRERRDHWIYGKALCAAGFAAAAELAAWLGYDEDGGRWRAEADKIRGQIVAEGYAEGRGAYLQTYDPDSPLDISSLALVLWDVLPAEDERMKSTVAVMEKPLRRPDPDAAVTGGCPTTDDPFWGLHELKGGLNMDGAFARYDYGAEPFYLPTLWMARYWLRAGDRGRAEELVRLCLRSATNLGLMAEHFNPGTGAQWGNFPQAFSHEELVLTILELERM